MGLLLVKSQLIWNPQRHLNASTEARRPHQTVVDQVGFDLVASRRRCAASELLLPQVANTDKRESNRHSACNPFLLNEGYLATLLSARGALALNAIRRNLKSSA